MSVHTICILLFLLTIAVAIQIPFIDNATFIPLSSSNDTIMINQTCNQCLCIFNSSYLALNCFPNNTCQFFHTFPRTYVIQSNLQARFYFLQQIFPNTSQCCMSNTDELANKLDTANTISVNITTPRCLVLDNHGYLVTTSQSPFTIVRFYPTNLTVIDQPVPPIFALSPLSITYYNEQPVNYTYPHGLRYINDSYFYVTSWSDNTIHSYSAINNNIFWMKKFFLDARSVTTGSDGNNLIIDGCDRYWFMLGANGIKIFDNQGLLLQNVTDMTSFSFDAVITDDYVIYISDIISNQIVRVDPNIQC